jgi:hypothetical protein
MKMINYEIFILILCQNKKVFDNNDKLYRFNVMMDHPIIEVSSIIKIMTNLSVQKWVLTFPNEFPL